MLVVCPIHPFWWPVKASVGKFLAQRRVRRLSRQPLPLGLFSHGRAGGGRGLRALHLEHGARRGSLSPAARRLCDPGGHGAARRARLRGAGAEARPGAPIFTSDQYNMYELVSVLRACDLMVSSRYHGIVTSMPALVPSAGVTMDERIRNLMQERGHEDLLMTVDDPDLEAKLLVAMEKLRSEADAMRDAIGRTVVQQSEAHGAHGRLPRANVHERYPEFPIAGGVRSWEEYLPPLSPRCATRRDL